MTIENKVTHARIVNQIATIHNEALRRTPFYKHNFKNKLNQFLPELIKCEKDYDEFFNKIEDSTVVVYDVYDAFLKAVASVPIWECKNITMIIEAYNTNPKAIEGIVKKVLKNKQL
jgi:hypothetical protein